MTWLVSPDAARDYWSLQGWNAAFVIIGVQCSCFHELPIFHKGQLVFLTGHSLLYGIFFGHFPFEAQVTFRLFWTGAKQAGGNSSASVSVDTSQQIKLCPGLWRGRCLLVLMFLHHPSPGGLPPLISTQRVVASCP